MAPPEAQSPGPVAGASGASWGLRRRGPGRPWRAVEAGDVTVHSWPCRGPGRLRWALPVPQGVLAGPELRVRSRRVPGIGCGL